MPGGTHGSPELITAPSVTRGDGQIGAWVIGMHRGDLTIPNLKFISDVTVKETERGQRGDVKQAAGEFLICADKSDLREKRSREDSV